MDIQTKEELKECKSLFKVLLFGSLTEYAKDHDIKYIKIYMGAYYHIKFCYNIN